MSTPPFPPQKMGRVRVEPTVVDVDYSKKITIGGKRTTLENCPLCGYAPHFPLTNGNKVCGFCGTEHHVEQPIHAV